MGVTVKFDDNTLHDAIVEALSLQAIEIECPHCHADIAIPAGLHPCPQCGEMIDLELKLD